MKSKIRLIKPRATKGRGEGPARNRGTRAVADWRTATATLISRISSQQSGKAFNNRAKSNAPIVLIADDRVPGGVFTQMLAQHDLAVIATARSGPETVRQVTRYKPHVLLLNSGTGDANTMRLVKAVKKSSVPTRVVVAHVGPAHGNVVEFVCAGAAGFIMKDASLAQSVETIRAVADGENVLPPSVTRTLFSHVAGEAVRPREKTPKGGHPMTGREHEVTALIAEGLANREIAARLGISENSVRTYVRNILKKLCLSTRLEIAAHAHRT